MKVFMEMRDERNGGFGSQPARHAKGAGKHPLFGNRALDVFFMTFEILNANRDCL